MFVPLPAAGSGLLFNFQKITMQTAYILIETAKKKTVAIINTQDEEVEPITIINAIHKAKWNDMSRPKLGELTCRTKWFDDHNHQCYLVNYIGAGTVYHLEKLPVISK